MNIVFEKVITGREHSFAMLHKKERRFKATYHFHPEIEITYIVSSEGMRLIGDNMSPFEAGDLVLIGPNLPHRYANFEKFDTQQDAEAYVIQFPTDFLGSAFFDAPEFKEVKRMLKRASRAIHFRGDTAYQARVVLDRLFQSDGLPRMLELLKLMHLLASSQEGVEVCSSTFTALASTEESSKVNRAIAYIQEHFDSDIRVENIARELNVSKATCNRLFIKSVGKSFKTILIEMRISHACRLLMETQQSILSIAYECGFNNLSNFNLQFRKIKGQTPRAFRNNAQQMQ